MIKRIFDILISTSILICVSPVILVVGLMVWIKLGWPIIFKQQRPGRNKIPFYFYKFRSMTNEMDKNGELLPNEQRLTVFGKFLRKTSLDELPSLFNVLKGDLSLVGPRPLRLKYNDCYSLEQDKRHLVKPGITGLAQVNGRVAISWEEKFKLDVEYVNNASFLLDIKILLKTVYVVMFWQGTTQGSKSFEQPFDEYMSRNEKN